MNNKFIGVAVVVVAVAVGIGGGFFAAKSVSAKVAESGNKVMKQYFKDRLNEPGQDFRLNRPGQNSRSRQSGRGQGQGMMPGGMPQRGNNALPGEKFAFEDSLEGERISMEDAVTKAQEYTAGVGDDLSVTEVMEFEGNFYAVVVESTTGKGAFELLVHPISSRVMQEMGPSRMWNTKYGHMRQSDDATATNKVTPEEAMAFAQSELDERISGAVVSKHGIDFYGYYSFDYEIDGKVAGMLSVNGEDGQVWFHTWHGAFISEMEIK